jgi:hypothetical protein
VAILTGILAGEIPAAELEPKDVTPERAKVSHPEAVAALHRAHAHTPVHQEEAR